MTKDASGFVMHRPMAKTSTAGKRRQGHPDENDDGFKSDRQLCRGELLETVLGLGLNIGA